MPQLGEKINSIEFSDAEKKRLAEALRIPNSLQAEIVRDQALKISDHRFWRSAQKQFRVTGFRDGNIKAREIVLNRAFSEIKTALDPSRIPIWSLYRRCTIEHVSGKLIALNKLLLNESFEESTGTFTEQIFKCIRKSLPLYGALAEEARQLYELWGFDRSDSVDKVLNDSSVDSGTVKRLVNSAVKETKLEIESELAALEKKWNAAIKELSVQTATALKAELTAIDASFQVRLKNADTESAKHSVEFSDRRNRIVEPTKVERKPHRRAEDFLAQLSSIRNDFQSQLDNLVRRMNDHDERFAAMNPAKEQRRDSTSLDTRKFNTVSELLSHCAEILQTRGLRFRRRESIWTLFSLLRSSRVILTDKESLPCCPLACLPNVEIKLTGVSPTWISQDSWRESLDFISIEHSAPRILVLLDFDVAIQEAYLLPNLLAWLSSMNGQSHNRIVLVPSKSDLSQVSDRIFEVSLVLMSSGNLVNDLRTTSDLDSTALDHVIESPVPRDLLRHTVMCNPEFERQMSAVAQNIGIAFPARLLENFISVYSLLKSNLPENMSALLATTGTLMPWVLRVRGEGVARVFEEATKVMFGKA